MKLCHPLELRLWRTGALILTKFNGHKSNVPCQWIHWQLFYKWKFNFRCPSKAFVSRISLWNTLYVDRFLFEKLFLASLSVIFLLLTRKSSIWSRKTHPFHSLIFHTVTTKYVDRFHFEKLFFSFHVFYWQEKSAIWSRKTQPLFNCLQYAS